MTSNHQRPTRRSNLGAGAAMLLLALLLVGAFNPAIGRSLVDDSSDSDEMRLMEVQLGQTIVADTLQAWDRGSNFLVPLGALSELLGIAITTDPSAGTATGFVLNEGRKFTLDIGRRKGRVGARTFSFAPAQVELHADDIYVDVSLFSDWIPADLRVDRFSSRIVVSPRETLPLQARAERMRLMQKNRQRLVREDLQLPRRSSPFLLFSLPFVDQTLRLVIGKNSSSASFATYATADLFYLSSELYLAGDSDTGLRDHRLTLSRKDPFAGLLGPMRAREVAVGYVTAPSSSLLTINRAPSPGFVVGNFPLQRPTQHSSHTMQGDLPPGWDVELYHNDALIDYRQSELDGRYAFDNVPLMFGLNVFRLVFHGPYGQTHVEVQSFVLGDSLTPPGQLHYRVVGTDEEDGRRGIVQAEYGLTHQFSLSAESAIEPFQGVEHTYQKAGLRGFIGPVFASTDYARAGDGGSALDLSLQMRILGVGIRAQHSTLSDGFNSEAFNWSTDRLLSRSFIQLESALFAGARRSPVSVEQKRETFESGRVRTETSGRFSTRVSRTSVSLQTRFQEDTSVVDRLDSRLQVSRYFGRFGLRGEADYEFRPEQELATLDFSIEGPLYHGYRFRVGLAHSVHDDSETVTIGVNKSVGLFAGSMTAIVRQGEATMNVNLSTGIGFEPREGSWIPSARAQAGQGALSFRVFVDSNLNGMMDPGEEPVRDAGLLINGALRSTRTRADGIAFVSQLPSHQPMDLVIDPKTLEDPMWKPATAGVRVLPRPGRTEVIDFPVIVTGEIEGTIGSSGEMVAVGSGGVPVQLLDSTGRVVQTVKSAFDGYFFMTGILPGVYTVRVDPGTIARLGKAVPTKRELVIGSGELSSGLDFELPGPTIRPELLAQAMPAIVPAATHIERVRSRVAIVPAVATKSAEASYGVRLGIFDEGAVYRMTSQLSSTGTATFTERAGRLVLLCAGPFQGKRELAEGKKRLETAGFSGRSFEIR